MYMKTCSLLAVALLSLTLYSCSGSDTCPCSSGTIDPPISDLLVGWNGGTISANLMPIVLPDPVQCQAWLILENRNTTKPFIKLEVPTADVVLARNDSIIGTIPLHTQWNGLLTPGKIDTVYFYKYAGHEESFDPPCGERVLLDFLIRNADGDARRFRSDTLTCTCVY